MRLSRRDPSRWSAIAEECSLCCFYRDRKYSSRAVSTQIPGRALTVQTRDSDFVGCKSRPSLALRFRMNRCGRSASPENAAIINFVDGPANVLQVRDNAVTSGAQCGNKGPK